MADSRKGKVQTVLGLIEPTDLGKTLTHEHLIMDFHCSHCIPPWDSVKHVTNLPITMNNISLISNYLWSNDDNLSMLGDEVEQSLVDEMIYYKSQGGSTVVEVTTVGIRRDVTATRRISQQSGVNIVTGTGFYVDETHTDFAKTASIEQLVDFMRDEITTGVGGDNKIKCGVIGEIGCSWPLTDNERKVLMASAIAQDELGAPLIIHPGRIEKAAFEICRILQESGADIKKTVMSHMDRTFMSSDEELLEFSEIGCYLEYDFFGINSPFYPFRDEHAMMPGDGERIKIVEKLIGEGLQNKILLAHDIHTKNRLMKYGGHGFSHILQNILPLMKSRGMSVDTADQIVVHNPREWLTFTK